MRADEAYEGDVIEASSRPGPLTVLPRMGAYTRAADVARRIELALRDDEPVRLVRRASP